MPACDNDLQGKWVLITGGAKRIGSSIARTLHEAGANIALHYRSSQNEAEALQASLEKQRPDSVALFQADLLEVDAINTLVSQVIAHSGRLDVLVNNASTFYATPIGTITEANWHDLIGTNLKAPLFLSQAAAPHLKAQNGVIINIVDIHARRPLKNHLVYGPAKAGLAMLTLSLAKDLAPHVRVNGIAPGAIMWPQDGISESAKENILAQIPLARTGSPDDIAGAVLYLARDATYVSGQILAIDGGRSVGW